MNSRSAVMLKMFLVTNLMLRREVGQRNHLPLGDAGWTGTLIPTDATATAVRHAG